jgi:hypothetical protein
MCGCVQSNTSTIVCVGVYSLTQLGIVSQMVLIAVPSMLHITVQENQLMLTGVFIILIKLPRHVSAANYYLQGVTRSL